MSLLNIKQFVSFIGASRKPLPAYIEQTVEFIKSSHKIIADYKPEKNCIETPPAIIDLVANIRNHGDFICACAKNVNAFKPVYNAISPETMTKDLEFIKNDTTKNEFNLDDFNGGQILFIKEIITNDIGRDIKHNFGSFKFNMSKNCVYMSKWANNSERNGRYHPYHTNEDKVCLGSFKEPYEIAMSLNNYFLAYSLVIQCLTVYGGDELKGRAAGPQNPIELWIGQICSVCDSSVALDEITVCGKTNRAICPKCVDSGTCTDEVNKEVYHPDVLKSCSKCGKLTHTVIRKVCFGCREKAVIGA